MVESSPTYQDYLALKDLVAFDPTSQTIYFKPKLFTSGKQNSGMRVISRAYARTYGASVERRLTYDEFLYYYPAIKTLLTSDCRAAY